MNTTSTTPESEATIRGRLLHEQLLAEANSAIIEYEWGPATEAPPLPFPPCPLRLVQATG